MNSVFYSQGEPGAFNVEGMQGSIEYSNIEDKTRDQNATDLEVEILKSMEERFPEDPSEKEAPGLVVRDVSQERKADDRRWAIGQDLVNEIRNLTNPDKWQILTYAKSADGKWEYEGKRAVRMKDIFVLTYNRSDMRRYYDRLSDAGIPCTMRADESVLGEVEAGWMQCLLEVALSAGRRGLAELLATPLFSKSIAEIYDEVVSDTGSQVAEIIRRATVEWKKFGFQSFLSQIVRECKIKEKLLKEQAGERHWTNFAQIAEILSDTEKSKHLSPDGLRDWLDDAVDSRKKSDEYTFRLESDEEAVTAMTIHKSKGLQAPIVFVAGINPSKKSSTEPVKTYYDDKGNSVLTINPEEHSERIRAEEIAEAIRLFYVAITRAENRTYYYMGKEDVKSEILSHLFKVSSTLEKGGPGVAIEDVVKDLDFSTVYRESEKEYNLIKPSVEISKITPWTMTSFSSLKDAIETFEFLEEADVTGKDFEYPAEDEPEDRPEESDDLETEGQIFPLRYIMPGGTVFGNYVHEIFEKCPFDAGKNEIREFAQKGLKDWDLEQTHGMPEYVKAITGMVYDTLTAAIPDACGRVFTLASIEASKLCIELEFHFPIEQARLSDLLQLVKSWGGIYAGESGKMRHLPVDINGMMKGFIDLVFEHEGRFYIVDWKTNVLDKTPSSFEIDCEDPLTSRIAEEIATAMYPLQWTIYTLALHRHLKNTLPGYDYVKHFGGVRYLFVRGISEDHPGAGIWVQPPLPVEAIEELDSFFKR
ncbi:MAG: hypothetical protein GX804_04910 [Lentisphaerae bacterium]|nr:hypothetical protein [Lentisphaerota bacterium]